MKTSLRALLGNIIVIATFFHTIAISKNGGKFAKQAEPDACRLGSEVWLGLETET